MARNREDRTNPGAGLRRGDEGALRLQVLTLGQAVLVFSKAPDLLHGRTLYGRNPIREPPGDA